MTITRKKNKKRDDNNKGEKEIEMKRDSSV